MAAWARACETDQTECFETHSSSYLQASDYHSHMDKKEWGDKKGEAQSVETKQ